MPSGFDRAASPTVEPERLRRAARELPVHVLPLAHAQVVEVLGLAQPPERAAAELALLLLEVVPEVEQGEEVARRVGEAGVQLVGLRRASRAAARADPGSSARRRSRAPRASTPCCFDSISMRAKRGSIGSRESSRPTSVSAGRARRAARRDRAELAQQVERRP